MRYKRSFLLLFLLGFLASCSTSSSDDDERLLYNPPPPPSDWKEINARGEFTFYLPAFMKEKDVHGIDSYVGVYESTVLRVSFDYGWYSGIPGGREMQDCAKEETQIGGQKAVIVSCRLDSSNAEKEFAYFTAAHFSGLSGAENAEKNKLTISAYCKTKNDCAIAHTIFGSIRFP